MITRFVRCLGLAALVQLATLVSLAATSSLGSNTTLWGEQKQWHKLSLTFTGPTVSESDGVNPFRNYRLNVTFKHVASGRTLVVPGYFAADGDAHNSGAVSGNKWRANFSPDATGTWTYLVSFRTGTDVAIATSSTAGTATSFNGTSGSFSVDPSDKTGADFRGKGRLQEVGQHYLQHLGSKEYFVKAGAGSPENFLAYADFDNTTAGRKPLHYYTKHLTHYRSGDPTWKNGKGKAIIGAVNYLAGKKMNSLYFLTMNVGGDGDDVFPWTTKSERYRFDVSKLTQWEVVFEHMGKQGIHLHVITQEQENDQLLDGGALGLQRKLYYRELVARFGHNLGLTWNLGEENTNSAAQRDSFADYINSLDPYLHLIAVHTFPGDRDTVYNATLGHPVIGAASLQLQGPSIVHAETLKWVKKSADSGQKWVVAVDELGAASVGVVPDENDPSHREIVHRVLWGSLMAGGAGVEWYFGYNYAHHDLTCEDFTSRENMWTLTHHAAQFFRDYMPLPLVANYNGITSSTSDYCFGKPGVAYAVYLPAGATTSITLPAGESYSVHWYNPRLGGALQSGTVSSVKGGSAVSIGRPASETSLDWVALLRRTASSDTSTGMSVSQLKLVDAVTQSDMRVITNGSVIDWSKDGVALNLRADVTGSVGSVVFYVGGKKIRTDSTAPFAYGLDDNGVYRSWKPMLGTHTMRAVPYSAANGEGSVGIPMEVTFTVIEGTSPPAEDETAMSVTKLTLVSAQTQSDMRTLTTGSVIDWSKDGTALNLRADVTGTVGSVVFYVGGKKIRTDNGAPFAYFLDDNGVYRSWKPMLGTHTMRAVPYSAANGEGSVGTPLEVTFTVIEGSSSTPDSSLVLGVSKLTLVNALTQSDMRILTNGSVIDWAKDGTALNLRADVTGSVGSVVYYVGGKKIRTDNAAPFAYFLDDNGVYRSWKPMLGTHTMRAVPYSAANGGGSVGIPFEVTFTVVEGAVVQPPPEPIAQMSVSRLMLVNAVTQSDVRALSNGSVIDWSKDGIALNLRADITGSVGSVVFYVGGRKIHTEGFAPFAYAGDKDGVYNKWKPMLGTHTMRVVPYSGANAGGSVGIPLEITFTVME